MIVDDLADGGRTFSLLAEELNSQGAEKVFLYVSHGQFNNGFDDLLKRIDGIFCTNSFRDIDHPNVQQFTII